MDQTKQQRINEAVELHQKGKLSQAEICYLKILENNEDRQPEVSFLLGSLYYQILKYDLALKYLCKAEQAGLELFEVYSHIALTYLKLGDDKNAEIYFIKALKLSPEELSIKYFLAQSLMNQNLHLKATSVYTEILQEKKIDLVALNQLGVCYTKLNQYKKALDIFDNILSVHPENWQARINKAVVLCQTGNNHEGLKLIKDFEDKRSISDWSNWLFYLNHDNFLSLNDKANECKKFNNFIQKEIKPSIIQGKKNKKIRIAYFSPDFRRHSVAYFALPLFKYHDKNKFDLFAYSNSLQSDSITEEFKKHSHNWNNVCKLSDEQFCNQIISDKIDILIDLAVHTEGGRIAVMAQKPAGIMINYLGYPATSGLLSYDYRLTDQYADPLNTEEYYSEKLIRLNECFLCFDSSLINTPKIGPAFLKNGYITFGSFNDHSKITERVLLCWANILKKIEGSRLLLKNRCLTDENIKNEIIMKFESLGITKDRIEIESWIPSSESHLTLYNKIDIALDTFPYNGTTTTCEALMMGVPVITLKQQTHASRVGASILNACKKDVLISLTEEEYISKACELANNHNLLRQLHQTIRDDLINSSIGSPERFVLEFENRLLSLI